MCGDGANDCAALSAADCGVALSEAEASLVSPFSARTLSTCSTVELIREGRACLTNSFAAFKYSIFYGITQVPTFSAVDTPFGPSPYLFFIVDSTNDDCIRTPSRFNPRNVHD